MREADLGRRFLLRGRRQTAEKNLGPRRAVAVRPESRERPRRGRR